MTHFLPIRQCIKLRKYSTEKKELILSVLRSTATKREAKQYMSKYTPLGEGSMRVAVLKIRDIKSIPEPQLLSIGATLSRLSKLGVSPVVVIDAARDKIPTIPGYNYPYNYHHNDDHNGQHHYTQQFRHFHRTITWKIGLVTDAIERANLRARPLESALELKNSSDNRAEIDLPQIVKPMLRGVIPVIAPVAYDCQTGQDKLVKANDVVYSLVQGLAKDYSVEKVIFIDPLGGIPSTERGGSHVYVNLQQELEDIRHELQQPHQRQQKVLYQIPQEEREIHLDNINAMNQILKLLPWSATGILTTPIVASLLSPSRNPIIYNVLTDRPVISPSLPVQGKKTLTLETTILRRGVPIKILKSDQGLDLVKEAEKGNIDLGRLESLINDSFGKTINMEHYLKRINGRVAGVIIAGDYQGAALITWESPAAQSAAPHEPPHVLYLDKFAVQKSSQGSTAVADVIFKAMIVHLFPHRDIVWRSRANNPVNKWYFERSRGSLQLEGAHWRMFWAGRAPDAETLLAYKDICLGIESSFDVAS